MLLLPPPPAPEDLETKAVLRKLSTARAALAELKGVASSIPNQQILIDTLSLQEAKDSSAIENIVTSHDEIYRSYSKERQFSSPAAKEVHSYAQALRYGFDFVRQKGYIPLNLILSLQEIIEGNKAGIRKLPGTVLKNDLTGDVVYEPPQDYDTIMRLMSDFEKFMNEDDRYPVDPLVKMALLHHNFESIHPFYDGNGRTGRVLNILYLIKYDLLSLPILYLSGYIIKHRAEYYGLLQQTRVTHSWEAWILYILDAVEVTSKKEVELVIKIKELMLSMKQRIRSEFPKLYSQDLINNLFRYPYTKINLIEEDIGVTRLTATKYLDLLSADVTMPILKKMKTTKGNYYINVALVKLLENYGF
jgi:Fic family protein